MIVVGAECGAPVPVMARSGSCGHWALAWVLLLGLTSDTAAAPGQVSRPYRAGGRCRNEETEYFLAEHEVCCARCPPGMYAAQQCTSDVNTLCRPCRADSYTEQWNFISDCITCPSCDNVMGIEEDISCSTTKKTVCKCKPGMFCEFPSQAGCVHCGEHSKCPPGKEVAEPGTSSSDTQCRACREGWFQNKTSLEAQCQRYTDCLSQGLQEMVPGTSTSDAVCSAVPTTKPTVVPTRSEGWNYVSTGIIIVVGFLASTIIIVIVLLIRNPSICKRIGMFFRHGHRTENPHHQGNSERPPAAEPLLSHGPTGVQNGPVEEPTHESEIEASFRPNDLALKMLCENLQLEAPLEFLGGGPYMQETEPMSPSAGPGTQGSQKSMSGKKSCTESSKRTQKMTRQAADSSNGKQIPAGTNNGVHIEGKKVTINGDIYVFPQTMVGPPASTEGSARPVQVTQDLGDMPTSIAEEGPLPAHQPPPFSGVAAAWHCVTPQQEEGKDMHLATPESMNEDALYGGSVRSSHMEEGGEIDHGQSLRAEILPLTSSSE
ncbi:tumor necrosis factor receptor superfamily member 3-like [Pleurodeles waltl]|uniref:tumor necrosis factor receptor superfamily member 3-like n=1 Tax=Pleurodeles waltl TaxID=8319 RepID=UPI0037095F91